MCHSGWQIAITVQRWAGKNMWLRSNSLTSSPSSASPPESEWSTNVCVRPSVCVSALPVECGARGACGTPQAGSLAVGWAGWARWWPARLTPSSACWQTQSTNVAASGKACRRENTLVYTDWKSNGMNRNEKKRVRYYDYIGYFILLFSNHIIPPQKKLKNT